MAEYAEEFIQWFESTWSEVKMSTPLLKEAFKEVAHAAWSHGRLTTLKEQLKDLTKQK